MEGNKADVVKRFSELTIWAKISKNELQEDEGWLGRQV